MPVSFPFWYSVPRLWNDEGVWLAFYGECSGRVPHASAVYSVACDVGAVRLEPAFFKEKMGESHVFSRFACYGFRDICGKDARVFSGH